MKRYFGGLMILIVPIVFFTGICVNAAEAKPTQAPMINVLFSETEETCNPITVTLDITDDEEIVSVNYVRKIHGAWNSSYNESGTNSELGASIPYYIDFQKELIEQEDSGEEKDDLYKRVVGDVEKGRIFDDYYSNILYNTDFDDPTNVENNQFTVYVNADYFIYAEDKSGNKTVKFITIDNINVPSCDVKVTYEDNYSGDYVAYVELENIVENKNSPIIYTALIPFNRSTQVSTGAYIDGNIYNKTIIERAEGISCAIKSIDGKYYVKDFGQYQLFFVDSWGNYTVSNRFEIKSQSNDNESKIYLYDIKNLSVLTQSGEALSVPPKNESFITEVTVNKKEDNDSEDYIIVAVYDTNGMLLNMDYVKSDFETNNNYDTFDFNIPAQSSEIGSIRTFVWNDLNSMKPLAETKTINFGVLD